MRLLLALALLVCKVLGDKDFCPCLHSLIDEELKATAPEEHKKEHGDTFYIEQALNLFFNEPEEYFDLAQLTEEVESGHIDCEAKELFKHLDKDQDAKVIPKELARHLKQCGWDWRHKAKWQMEVELEVEARLAADSQLSNLYWSTMSAACLLILLACMVCVIRLNTSLWRRAVKIFMSAHRDTCP